MKNPVVVIRRDKKFNETWSSIRYDRYGSIVWHEFIIVDDWKSGFQQAVTQGYSSALFVDSGTIFENWIEWVKSLECYPHRGLIAHIVWRPGQTPCLHQQCFFMELGNFDASCFDTSEVEYPTPLRSQQNIHDDYTPLHLRPGEGQVKHSVSQFGQGLIARQLSLGLPVVNFNQSLREHKRYLYSQELLDNWIEQQNDYKQLAKNQLWILNNEPIKIVPGQRLVMPAAGLYWVLNAINPKTQQIKLVDISSRQIDFAQHLWDNWSGTQYGSFVYDYIKQNNLVHVQFDNPNLDELQRLKLRSKDHFIAYVDDRVSELLQEHGVTDFEKYWKQAHTRVAVDFYNDNLVDWITQKNITDIDGIWLSNILDYKITRLESTADDIDRFHRAIQGIELV